MRAMLVGGGALRSVFFIAGGLVLAAGNSNGLWLGPLEFSLSWSQSFVRVLREKPNKQAGPPYWKQVLGVFFLTWSQDFLCASVGQA